MSKKGLPRAIKTPPVKEKVKELLEGNQDTEAPGLTYVAEPAWSTHSAGKRCIIAGGVVFGVMDSIRGIKT